VKWKKSEYSSWDDAFHGLVPSLRRASARIADYTQVLFKKALATPFGSGSVYTERICPEYEELAYKCGLYHQLGKAQFPPEYQIEQRDFSPEERAAFRLYTSDGRLLVANLQERGNRRWLPHKGSQAEKPTKNIPWLMIRESCSQHMERWDGSGYPAGLREDEISPIAQIVSLAHALDTLTSETVSEDAFGYAIQRLVSQAGTAFNPALIAVLEQAEPECKEIFEKYFFYSKAVPKTVPLVEKRSERPMGLHFRAIPGQDGKTVAYEAEPWFRGIASQPEETAINAELCDMISRAELIQQVSEYFLYEAADLAQRLQNCKLDSRYVVLEMLPDFYSEQSRLSALTVLYSDQPAALGQLLLTVPESKVVSATSAEAEVLRGYLQSGVALLLDGFHPGNVSREALTEFGFTFLRCAPELSDDPTAKKALRELEDAGFMFIGSPQGDVIGEDELIRAALAELNG
jgi:EAL domain-containing protein (putative c-di-GMP-specific phosphodiesterase class I)